MVQLQPSKVVTLVCLLTVILIKSQQNVNPAGARRHVCPRASTGLSSHKVGRTTNPKIVPAPNKWSSSVAH
jgi:hypothetical protein